jgi:uncharacterized membrane protein YqaE (UPF0057 family)
MTDDNSTTPAAGWYPDPAGTPRTRWWDGTRWTENYSAPTAEAAATPWSTPAGTAGQAPTVVGGAPSAYPGMQPYGAAPALKAPEGTSPSTPFIWVLALLPLVTIIQSIVQLVTIDELVAAALADSGVSYTPLDLVTTGVSLLLAAAVVVLAFFDARALAARGVPRPFHWAWSFFALVSAPVYMIGRSIVVRRRVGSGLAPMFVNLALILIGFVLGIVAAVIVTTRIFESIPGL